MWILVLTLRNLIIKVFVDGGFERSGFPIITVLRKEAL